jgi:hypothetical protein
LRTSFAQPRPVWDSGWFALAVLVFSPGGRRDGNSCLRSEAQMAAFPYRTTRSTI